MNERMIESISQPTEESTMILYESLTKFHKEVVKIHKSRMCESEEILSVFCGYSLNNHF